MSPSSIWSRARLGLLAMALVAAATMGCAQEREPINRVQANAMAKSFFVGPDLVSPLDNPEFWTQASIIDVGFGTQGYLLPSTFTQEPHRIKWEITEDLLLGRLPYERIEGTDGKGVGGLTPDGQVVVAFAIVKHFDIRRAYNPSTGEELNVIEENASDRPWYEREYFRVDWSQNLNTDAYDFDTLSLLGVYSGLQYSPLAYYVSDPNHEHAPFFNVNDGYFDVTNKAWVTPGLVDLSHLGWGIKSFPACFLPRDFFGGSEPTGNCNPNEITIRHAFRKLVDTDYEPKEWDGFRFQAYGGFYKDRWGFARMYGMSDDKWHRFLTRYNIWERSHYYDDPEAMTGAVECYTPETYHVGDDPHADDVKDGTEDACWTVAVKLAIEAGVCDADDDPVECFYEANVEFGGSTCDTFKQRCTLPYRARTPKPMPWYFTDRSNRVYYESTTWAVHDHDVAMRHAIMTARYAECMNTADRSESLEERKETCVEKWPVYFGQMDDHLDAIQLAREVDDCRHGLSYMGENGQADHGAINSEEREAACVALAAKVADDRGLDAWEDTSPHRRDSLVALAEMPEQIVLCHSPVQADDPALCAPSEERLPADLTMADCQIAVDEADLATVATCREARTVRMGDLRYHKINVFQEAQSPSFWGIYSDCEDPLTGETFAASINVWSWVNDYFSQMVVDKMRYIKGELSTEEITDGSFVRDWATADEAASGAGMGPKLSREQVDKRLAAALEVDESKIAEFRAYKGQDQQMDQRIRKLKSELTGVSAAVDAPGHMAATYELRRNYMANTPIEAELTDPMMQQLGGVADMGMGEGVIQFASPIRRLDPHHIRQLNNIFEANLAARGTCILREAPAAMALTGLADVMESKFAAKWGEFGTGNQGDDPTITDEDWQAMRAEAMRKYVANHLHHAVIVHEMGHSVGMRHNFVSSSDAQNYRPQYWQLRTKDGTVTESCETYTEDGSTCIGPRWFDPLDGDERDNMIWMWMQSSVMEYPGEYTQDMIGVGAWDFAAHRMFYGDTVAVFADESYELKQDRADYQIFKMDSFGGIVGYRPEFTVDNEPINIHYSEYHKHYEMIQDCQVVDETTYKPASYDEERDGDWSPLLDGWIVNVNGDYTKCRQQPVDYVPWNAQRFPTMTELKDAAHASYEPYYRGGPAIDRDKRVRVPYGFATDRWADIGNAAVYRHDNGADNYEIFDFLISQMEVQHIFDSYRRGRQAFSVRSVSNRTLGRYNEKMRDGAKGLGLYHSWYEDLAQELNLTHSSFWGYAATNWFPDQMLAAGMVFDHFTRQHARPERGEHIQDGGILRSLEDTQLEGAPLVTVPDGATGYFGQLTFGGKLVENRLCETTWNTDGKVDPGCGEYDSDFTMNAGSYYEKAWVPYLMAESEDNFISDSREDFVDGRYRAVSLADVFPEGYRRWLANSLTGDLDITALHIGASAPGQPAVDEEIQPDGTTVLWPSYPLGTITWWTKEPEVCFPAAGTTVCNRYNAYSNVGDAFVPQAPPATMPIDPQIGWQAQKFLIAYTFLYIPENEKRAWLDMMRLWKLGTESDPGMPPEARIEWHSPVGDIYVARRFGTEEIFGKTVERGIGARVLEYCNSLMEDAYEGAWNAAGTFYLPAYDPTTGQVIVKYDSGMGSQGPVVAENCNGTDNSGCTCEDNKACLTLKRYAAVPHFMWEVGMDVHYDPNPDHKGIY